MTKAEVVVKEVVVAVAVLVASAVEEADLATDRSVVDPQEGVGIHPDILDTAAVPANSRLAYHNILQVQVAVLVDSFVAEVPVVATA